MVLVQIASILVQRLVVMSKFNFVADANLDLNRGGASEAPTVSL